ncbi:MAG TPA: ATP phosphoribosyltransferase regulatory subunit [Sedimenticola thiotaurini]|uniref:ATP phosphoribosyltransferase regulatory subunit n=1 Tax=Sedimenticola thiotaurini TaxID=1543721 RepID=A0A831W2E8_9GAMM|nr:ATP phosphoribosyltransferase regulatory subunit [Sedimenticola thiotaurini]
MNPDNTHWLLPEGISEVLPPQAAALEALRRDLLDLYRGWGYELVFPPFIEYLDSLMTGAGSDLDLQTFKVTDQITGRTLGIRADITPQVARIDAHQLRREAPTRLCYLGTVLNTTARGLAGSRSPLQIGAELYGHAGVEADLEVIRLMLESLRLAGIEGPFLDLGHVGIFRGLSRQAGLRQEQELALFDALQRKAVPEIEALVARFDIPSPVGEMLAALSWLSGDDAIDRAREALAAADSEVQCELDQLALLAERLAERHPGLPVHYDLAELRGYRYHTGMVFAAYLPGMGQEVARGGRYDDIGALFGHARPACGFSTDLNLLLRLGRRPAPAGGGCIFAPADGDAALQRTVETLRGAGERVVQGLPGQAGGAAEMGCDRVLQRRHDGEWVVIDLG